MCVHSGTFGNFSDVVWILHARACIDITPHINFNLTAMSQLSQTPATNQKPYYAQDVDFEDLAKRDPDWAAICKTSKQTKWIDFQDPKILLYVYSASCPGPQKLLYRF